MWSEVAGGGFQFRLERRGTRKQHPDGVEAERVVPEPLGNAFADCVLVLRLGDARAQAEQRGAEAGGIGVAC